MKMCLNKKNGCSGCSATSGCCRLKPVNVQNSKLPLKSCEPAVGNIGNKQYNTSITGSMNIKWERFADNG